MRRLLCLGVLALSVSGLSGCATLTGEPTQKITVQTVDAEDKIINGMSCRVSNSSADYVGVTPMFDMHVRRSSSPLIIECRRDGVALARAVIISRATDVQPLQMLLPGGTSMMVLDHFSGYIYSYPRWVRIQIGADMVFDRRDHRDRDPTPGLVTRQFDDYVRFASGFGTRPE